MGYRSRINRTGEPISVDVAKRRALVALDAIFKSSRGMSLAAPSQIAWSIWPGHQMRAQGAGLAAVRILALLDKDRLAKWRSTNTRGFENWGWQITTEGRAWVRKHLSD